MTIICPIDHGVDCIQKVSAIVANNNTYPRKLYPPILPTTPKMPWYFWFPGLLYSITVPFFVWKITPGFWGDLVGILLWGLIPIGIAILRFSQKKRKYYVDIMEYDAKCILWDKLYYCHRHDVVFNADTGEKY
jgi:hypothetical protein